MTIIKKENRVAFFTMTGFLAVMIAMFVLSFFNLKGFDVVYYYMSSILIFVSVVFCYTFFGYNQTKDGKLMCCLIFLFAACAVTKGLLSSSIFVVGRPETVIYPILAIFYLFVLSYMFPDKAIGKKPLSFIIAVMTLVLFELSLVLDKTYYHTSLLIIFECVIGGLCVWNIVKKRKMGYNILIGITNLVGIACGIMALCGAEFLPLAQKVTANTQILLMEFILFYHYFTKKSTSNAEDII